MMDLPELSKFLPRAMPYPLSLRKGDKVFVRMHRCPHLLQVGHVTRIELAGAEVSVMTLEHGASDFVIEIKMESGVFFELKQGSDVVYTPAWVNLYAGTKIVEEPAPKGSGRLARLLGTN